MNGALTDIATLGAAFLEGGTFEKVLFVVLVVAVLIALVLVAWLVYKLVGLFGGALLRGAASAAARAKERRARQASEREEALPRVRAGWMQGERPSLRRAIREAGRIAEEETPWAIVVCGDGSAALESELGIPPAPSAEIRLSASERLVLIDAANAPERTLRHLARRLPWRRPFDALLVLAAHGAVPPPAAHRAALVARGAGVTAALHVVIPGANGAGAARIVEPGPGRTREVLSYLEADMARAWLGGGGRDGIGAAQRKLGDGLEEALRALRDRAPRYLDLTGLIVGGGRLRETIGAGAARTVPRRRGPLAMQGAMAVLIAGFGLGAAGALTAVRDADRLESLMKVVEGQRIEELARADLVPDPARTGAIAKLAIELGQAGGSTWSRPAGRWIPGAGASRALARDMLVGYVGRPLGEEIERRAADLLAPAKDVETWIERAARAEQIRAGWAALLAGASEADVDELLETVFGEREGGWPEGVGTALEATGADRALEGLAVSGGHRLREAAREGLLASVDEGAKSRYIEAPVLSEARVAADPAASDAARRTALERVREGLEQPAAAWLAEAEDRPQHAEILPVLARALGLPIVESAWVARAEADLSRARRQARDEALRIAGPKLGAVLTRGEIGTKLRLSSAARAWLEVLEQIEAARLAPVAAGGDDGKSRIGPFTLDAERVRSAQARIERYGDIEAKAPPSLPPALAEATLSGARERLALGLANEIDGMLVPLPPTGAYGAPREPDRELIGAIETTRRIARWLEDHGWRETAREARTAADRVIESHLRQGLDALYAADPIRIGFARKGADPERIRERLARSLEAIRELDRSYAEPLLALAGEARGEAARSWRSLERALAAHERGDSRSGIGGIESLLDAFAADPRGTCAHPKLPPVPPGYLGQVVRRTRSELETACRERAREELIAARDQVLERFDESLARSWPYSGDPASPDAPREAVDRYVSALAAAPDLSVLDARYAPELERERALWMMDEGGGACIGLGIEWRARPAEDENAHHLIAIEIEGTKQGEDGGYTWRYGTPVTLRLKLARNSPYRFAGGAGAETIEYVERFEGSAALLRMLDSLAGRGWTVRAPLVDEAGRGAELRLSVRAFRHGGAPFALPVFASLGRGLAGRRA